MKNISKILVTSTAAFALVFGLTSCANTSDAKVAPPAEETTQTTTPDVETVEEVEETTPAIAAMEFSFPCDTTVPTVEGFQVPAMPVEFFNGPTESGMSCDESNELMGSKMASLSLMGTVTDEAGLDTWTAETFTEANGWVPDAMNEGVFFRTHTDGTLMYVSVYKGDGALVSVNYSYMPNA